MGDSVVLQQREQKSLFSTDRNRQKTERKRERERERGLADTRILQADTGDGLDVLSRRTGAQKNLSKSRERERNTAAYSGPEISLRISPYI